MIEYVIEANPDDRILQKASAILKDGNLICLPTDTNWVMVADITSKVGIEKLYKIKRELMQKHFSILCDSISMAADIAIIDTQSFRMINRITPGNYTFIFEASKKIAKLVQASKTDKEVGVRFVPRNLVNRLIEIHGSPLISSNITPKLINRSEEDDSPIYSFELEEKLAGTIQMIIDPGEIDFDGISSIIDFSQNTGPILIREGVGPVDFLR